MTAESHTFTPRSFVKDHKTGLARKFKPQKPEVSEDSANSCQTARDPVCSPSRFPVGCSQLAALLCRVWAGQRSRTLSKAALQQAYQLGRGWQRSKSALISSEGRR